MVPNWIGIAVLMLASMLLGYIIAVADWSLREMQTSKKEHQRDRERIKKQIRDGARKLGQD